MGLDRSGGVLRARLGLAPDRECDRRGQASGMSRQLVLICLEELWGRHSEIRAVSGFVSCTNMQKNWDFVGRKGSEEAGNSTGEGYFLWGSKESMIHSPVQEVLPKGSKRPLSLISALG